MSTHFYPPGRIMSTGEKATPAQISAKLMKPKVQRPIQSPMMSKICMDDPVIKVEDPSLTDLIRRVPAKIAVHTGLRNTFACRKAQEEEEEARKPYQRSPINPKMVNAEDILKKVATTKQPTILSRTTLMKIDKPQIHYRRADGKEVSINKLPTWTGRPKMVSNVANIVHFKRPLMGCKRVAVVPSPPSTKEVKTEEVEDVKPQNTIIEVKKESVEVKQEVVEDEEPPIKKRPPYHGVYGCEGIVGYESKDRFSEQHPELARKLSKLFNIPLKSNETIAERFHQPQPTRPIKVHKLPHLEAKASGPVSVEALNDDVCLRQLLNNDGNAAKMIKVVFNGHHAEIPEEIYCHLCDFSMKLCMRKTSYRGELREYPSYRCLRKGCQTFRAIKKILEPDFSKKYKDGDEEHVKSKGSVQPEAIMNTLMSDPSAELVIDGDSNSDKNSDEDEGQVEWNDIPQLSKKPAKKGSSAYDDFFEVEEQNSEL